MTKNKTNINKAMPIAGKYSACQRLLPIARWMQNSTANLKDGLKDSYKGKIV